MALGNYDNNKKDKQYMPVYYSEYGTGNKDGVDPSALSYTFYGRMLKLSISPLKMNNGDKVSYDHENAAIVWLTHTKARMLYNEINKVLKGEIENGGVSTGAEGLVIFTNGKELGIPNYCLIISKVNENGEIISSYAYEFKTKHHFAVENYSSKDSSHKKVYYNELEIDQFLDLLKSYYEAMTGAMAYSVLDAARFNINSNNTKLDLIMSKLGVEYKSGMTSRSSKSFFDNTDPSNDRNIRTATMDDLD